MLTEIVYVLLDAMNDLITWLSENLRDFGICVAEIRRNSKTKKLVFFASEVST